LSLHLIVPHFSSWRGRYRANKSEFVINTRVKRAKAIRSIRWIGSFSRRVVAVKSAEIPRSSRRVKHHAALAADFSHNAKLTRHKIEPHARIAYARSPTRSLTAPFTSRRYVAGAEEEHGVQFNIGSFINSLTSDHGSIVIASGWRFGALGTPKVPRSAAQNLPHGSLNVHGGTF